MYVEHNIQSMDAIASVDLQELVFSACKSAQGYRGAAGAAATRCPNNTHCQWLL